MNAQSSLPNGAPIPGTDQYFYLEDEKQKSFRAGYKAGVEFVLKDMEQRLEDLVYFRSNQDEEDDLRKLQDLPKTFPMIYKYFRCLYGYIRGLKTQINNTNVTNFREGTHKMILRTERILKRKRGEIINPLLGKKLKPYVDNRFPPPGRKRKNPVVEDTEQENDSQSNEIKSN